jgi:hypothetical protein
MNKAKRDVLSTEWYAVWSRARAASVPRTGGSGSGGQQEKKTKTKANGKPCSRCIYSHPAFRIGGAGQLQEEDSDAMPVRACSCGASSNSKKPSDLRLQDDQLVAK